MRPALILMSFMTLVAIPADAQAQKEKKQQEAAFVKSSPTIGELLPDVTVNLSDGTSLNTSELRGHYTVLTFGCLT